MSVRTIDVIIALIAVSILRILFSVLGMHQTDADLVRALLPDATEAWVIGPKPDGKVGKLIALDFAVFLCSTSRRKNFFHIGWPLSQYGQQNLIDDHVLGAR